MTTHATWTGIEWLSVVTTAIALGLWIDRKGGGITGLNKKKPQAEVGGVIDSMRDLNARIAYMALDVDDEKVVVLIGRAERADELAQLYAQMDITEIVTMNFGPKPDAA